MKIDSMEEIIGHIFSNAYYKTEELIKEHVHFFPKKTDCKSIIPLHKLCGTTEERRETMNVLVSDE